ncbi:MAG TPA: YfiR/HmsC family protein, partial [Bacteroidales bacterium]|nr:YfiR/HmsC family protein [Bacteroidales bacterium]
MSIYIRTFKTLVLAACLFIVSNSSYSQVGFDNPTRALYIFDLAKYVDYGPGFADSANFKIGVLLGDYDLINEMGNLSKTRNRIQDKPVSVAGFKNLESVTHCQVLYVNKNAGFNLDKIKKMIEGQQTMLITEGYEFRESMMNFIVVEGKPRFDINDEYIKKEKMSVPETLLFTAIKTKEDWQNLFDIASKEIEVQKETIRQQLETIDVQKKEIMVQRALLDSLDKQIVIKEKTLNEKQKVLDKQFVQINRQQGEISSQKKM